MTLKMGILVGVDRELRNAEVKVFDLVELG